MRGAWLAVLVSGLLGAPLSAVQQDRGTEPAFEVVSIKPSVGERVARATGAPDRYAADMTLRNLIQMGWELPVFRIAGAPAWAASERFVINAKAPAPLAPGELLPMVRRMVRERFGLRAHVESREMEVYELVLARADRRLGPSLTAAAFDCEPFLSGRRPMKESGVDQNGRPRCLVRLTTREGGAVTQHMAGAGLSRLITSLENLLARGVIDKTGLEGPFDMDLTFTREGLNTASRALPAGSQEGPALFTALEEQLGLRLVPARASIEVFVIDAVERPTPD
jgi:uncharacterized protein (TIGR03435 family)